MITDPSAIKFANERVRTAADLLAQGYYRAKAALDMYEAQSLEPLFADTEYLDDGAPADGRPQITGAQVKAILTEMQAFVSNLEAADNAKLKTVLSVAVNPTAR